MTGTSIDATAVIPALDHRPDIQWLRGLAVALVIAYHLDVPGTGWAYVGVDVFFVLSGYLITRLLLHEVARTGRVDLRRFWLRRVRRLLPMATLVLVATIGGMLLLQGPVLRSTQALPVRGAALFGANVGLALQQSDYLAPGGETAVQHYWSLGVEEQFYLLWPLLVLGAAVLARRRSWDTTTAVTGLTVLVTVTSVLAARTLDAVHPAYAFHLLPARAWELAVGALLAAGELAGRRPSARAAWRVAGLVLLGATAIGQGAVRFPWPLAVLPVLGTAALVWAGVREAASPRWMGGGTMRWLGDRSYSLYLWHWPPIVLLGLTDTPWPGRPLARLGVLVATIVLAAWSYRAVEQPFQRTRTSPQRTTAAALIAIGATTALAIAATAPPAPPDPVPAASPAPPADATPDATPSIVPTTSPADPLLAAVLDVPAQLPATLRPSLATATTQRPAAYEDGCHALAADPAPEPADACTYGATDGAVTVLLVGDSHAAQHFPAARAMAEARGWRLVSWTKSACGLFAPMAELFVDSVVASCPLWRDATLDAIAALAPDVVLTAGAITHEERAMPDAWAAETRTGLERLRAAPPTAALVLLLDPPRAEDVVPFCLEEAGGLVAPCAVAASPAVDEQQRALAAAMADGVLDVPALLCRAGSCPAVIGDLLVYRDADHITVEASLLLLPALERATDDALAATRSGPSRR